MIGGVGLPKSPARPSSVTPPSPMTIRCSRNALDVGGEYVPQRGESHVDARYRGDLQHAVRGNVPEKYRDYARR
jgi:hypothetical protein